MPWMRALRDYRGSTAALTWTVDARQGSRYDVRRFIVEVEYDVLE